MAVLEVKNLKKIYRTRLGGNQVEALSNVSFAVEQGEFLAVMGESGSGKTTLLNILASFDRASEGTVMMNGKSYEAIKEADIAAFRRDHLGFVFQDFNLLDNLNVQDNILLPLVLADRPGEEMKNRLDPLARRLGIDGLLKKYPYEISGGQRQRVAIARALITHPDLILADEPTGALDSRASADLLKLLTEINRTGQTIIMVTHSVKAASYASRVLFIKDGKIYCKVTRRFAEEDIQEQIFSVLSAMSNAGVAHE